MPPRLHRWLLLLLLAAALAADLLASARPTVLVSEVGVLDIGIKKVGHFAGYALIGALLSLNGRAWGRFAAAASRWAVLASAAWACSDELRQALVPGRSPAVSDVLVDIAGAAAGIALASLAVRLDVARRRRTTAAPAA